MRKTQFCRICRTENNLKYTAKDLRQLNKKQLLLAESTQRGQANNRASKKLLLATPTLGNICHICDERIQIFHRLDDGGHGSSSDVEIDVVHNVNGSLPIRLVETLPNGDLQRTQRPETPVIVDDDDMLFNIFMQKFDQKTQLPRDQINSSYPQQQQFANQFHSTYTPPQSTGGGSEGDETKVIEIVTSRESTPAPTNPLATITSNSEIVDNQGHRIVAIIEIDDVDDDEIEQKQVKDVEIQKDSCIPVKNASNNLSYNENVERKSALLPPINNNSSNMHETLQTTNVVEDDDEIVFCKVDNIEPAPLKKRKRKSYDEKELRLVASLNLVSSDSEAEDIPRKKVQMTPLSEPAITAVRKSFICSVCELKFPDLESLSVHERIHQGVKCTLCTVGFQQVKRLIHHMRRKHREYNGDALSEKPRSGQDSCMTIRLRYMQRTTFYECQLCGRIDDVFREHKEHIIEKHPNESKSLKDPIMKQLKCPVCKAKCGAQYLSLCRHLISLHEYQEYKSHLREILHVSAFGWNAARQQEVAKTAKIFQFTKRKTFFFECKVCCKVVAGYLNHLRHVKEHPKSGNSEKEVTAYKNILRIKAPSTVAESDISPLEKLSKTLKNNGICISKNLRKKDTLPKNLVNRTNLKSKTKQIGKVIDMSNKIEKSKVADGQKTEKVKKSIEATVQAKNYTDSSKKQSGKKLQLKNKCKMKSKEVEKLSDCVTLTKSKSKKESCKGENKKLKTKSTKKDIELKTQLKKIIVKTPIKQIDPQKYKCKYCLKKFKGFRLHNLHLLQQHAENEYTKCKQCNKLYATSSNFEKHIKKCQIFSTIKQKRKFIKQSQNLTESSQLFVKIVPNRNDISSGYTEGNYIWLKELLTLKDSNLKLPDSPKTALFNTQCCYCLHLFVNDEQLMKHKEHHHYHNPDILLRYKPLKKT